MAFRPGYTPMYHEGNDYPLSGECAHWIPYSYSAGIIESEDKNYISGGWNKLFRTVLPQSSWSGVNDATKADLEKNFSAFYSIDYATASAVPQSAWEKYVSATNYIKQ